MSIPDPPLGLILPNINVLSLEYIDKFNGIAMRRNLDKIGTDLILRELKINKNNSIREFNRLIDDIDIYLNSLDKNDQIQKVFFDIEDEFKQTIISARDDYIKNIKK